jgi:hypothetical protein
MTRTTTKPDSLQPAAEMAVDLFDNWFDPIETEVRARAREFIEEMIRGELDTVLARPRYSRSQMAGNEGRAQPVFPLPRGFRPDGVSRKAAHLFTALACEVGHVARNRRTDRQSEPPHILRAGLGAIHRSVTQKYGGHHEQQGGQFGVDHRRAGLCISGRSARSFLRVGVSE